MGLPPPASALFGGAEHDVAELAARREILRDNTQVPDSRLDALPPREAQIRRFRYALAAEVLARHCLAHLVENKHLWAHFTDDQVETFWGRPIDEQMRIWGPPFDLTAALTEFDPERLPRAQP